MHQGMRKWQNAWLDILKDKNEIDGVHYAGTDIGTYKLNYLIRFKPECIENAFEVICNTHKLFISAS